METVPGDPEELANASPMAQSKPMGISKDEAQAAACDVLNEARRLRAVLERKKIVGGNRD